MYIFLHNTMKELSNDKLLWRRRAVTTLKHIYQIWLEFFPTYMYGHRSNTTLYLIVIKQVPLSGVRTHMHYSCS